MALIDYLVLTPLDEEWGTVRQVLCPLRSNVTERPIEAITYYLWKQPVDQPPDAVGDYLIVAASMARRTPGQSYAGVFSTHCVNAWKPSRVVLMGIAGSLEPDRIQLGDVVVSDKIFGYEIGDTEGKKTTYRPTFHQTSALDIDRVRAFRNDSVDYANWQRECRNAASATGLKKLNRVPELHLEVTASGNYVVKSKTFGQKLKSEIDPEISAVEMEGKGLHQALFLNVNRTDALMIRGISDYADSNKARLERKTKNAWRAFASANAARLLKAILRRGPVTPVSSAYSLDLKPGSYLELRGSNASKIEFKRRGAQNNVFPYLLRRSRATPKLLLKVIANTNGRETLTDFKGICMVESPDHHEIQGSLKSDGMEFVLPASEWGLHAKLFLSFPVRVPEIKVICSDEFQRSTEARLG